MNSGETSTMAAASPAQAALDLGIKRLLVLAWHDIQHPLAGGSEKYVDRVAAEWARMGFEVSIRTSKVDGLPKRVERGEIEVIRMGSGRAAGPRTAFAGLFGRLPAHDAVIDVWDILPFWTPVWSRKPRLTIMHNLSTQLWGTVAPRPLAPFGRFAHRSLAPKFYRRSSIATLSDSTRSHIADRTSLKEANIHVVPPGVDPALCIDPGYNPPIAQKPIVIIVARLEKSKRVDAALWAVERLRRSTPDLTTVVVGTGPEMKRLQADSGRHIRFVGYVDAQQLLRLYRSAWAILAPSKTEGWGMTITEAAACGTPAIAIKSPGHSDAVIHEETGLLVDDDDEMVEALRRVLTDHELRERLAEAGIARSSSLRWETTALGLLELLGNQAR